MSFTSRSPFRFSVKIGEKNPLWFLMGMGEVGSGGGGRRAGGLKGLVGLVGGGFMGG